MPARFLTGLGLNTTLTRTSQVTAILLLALVAASTVAWFVERRVADLMLANLVARATDQVELGLVPRLTPADFEPPYTQAKLESLDMRLDPILVRAREAASGVIRIDVFARDGTVLYSDLASLQGQVVSPLANPHLAAALAGSVSAEVSSLTRQEDADLKRRYDSALEAYVPCILDGRVVGVYEVYTEPGPYLLMWSTIWTTFGLAVALLLCGAVGLSRAWSNPAVVIGVPNGTDMTHAPPLIRTGLVRQTGGDDGAGCRAGQGRAAAIATPLSSASECWLSRREMEVLHLLASNRRYREIGEELSVSEETVRSHVKSILHKLGQPDRGRAVAAAVRAGILPG